MADQGEVEAALAAAVAGALYPEGTAAPSVVGVACRVHRGWPEPAGLDADLAAGRVRVSVSAVAESQRLTTRFPDGWQVRTPRAVTLTATVAGDTVTLGGSADAGQLVGVLVAGVTAVRRTAAGDTLPSVAAALAEQLPRLGATAQGAVLTVPGTDGIVARTVGDQPAIRETRRQRQGFRVVCWCPDPDLRDRVGAAVDSALSAVDFVGLPDGMAGWLRFVASVVSDRGTAAGLYRRDLLYSVDYATTLQTSLPCLLFGETRVVPDGVVSKTLLS